MGTVGTPHPMSSFICMSAVVPRHYSDVSQSLTTAASVCLFTPHRCAAATAAAVVKSAVKSGRCSIVCFIYFLKVREKGIPWLTGRKGLRRGYSVDDLRIPSGVVCQGIGPRAP